MLLLLKNGSKLPPPSDSSEEIGLGFLHGLYLSKAYLPKKTGKDLAAAELLLQNAEKEQIGVLSALFAPFSYLPFDGDPIFRRLRLPLPNLVPRPLHRVLRS